MRIFLIEEVFRKDGSWDANSKRILGYIIAVSLEELVKKMGIVTTCCGSSVGGRVSVKEWQPSKGWLITELSSIDPAKIK